MFDKISFRQNCEIFTEEPESEFSKNKVFFNLENTDGELDLLYRFPALFLTCISPIPFSFSGDTMSAEEYQKTIDQCIAELDMIGNDTSVPRNIRRSVSEIIETLKDSNQELFLRAASALKTLSEVSYDQNLPNHIGTLIWSVLGKLETIPPEA